MAGADEATKEPQGALTIDSYKNLARLHFGLRAFGRGNNLVAPLQPLFGGVTVIMIKLVSASARNEQLERTIQ